MEDEENSQPSSFRDFIQDLIKILGHTPWLRKLKDKEGHEAIVLVKCNEEAIDLSLFWTNDPEPERFSFWQLNMDEETLATVLNVSGIFFSELREAAEMLGGVLSRASLDGTPELKIAREKEGKITVATMCFNEDNDLGDLKVQMRPVEASVSMNVLGVLEPFLEFDHKGVPKITHVAKGPETASGGMASGATAGGKSGKGDKPAAPKRAVPKDFLNPNMMRTKKKEFKLKPRSDDP